jgi:hypothetical protein
MIKIRNEGGSFSNGWRILTNPAFADFAMGPFDERKGVISVYDYGSYNR